MYIKKYSLYIYISFMLYYQLNIKYKIVVYHHIYDYMLPHITIEYQHNMIFVLVHCILLYNIKY